MSATAYAAISKEVGEIIDRSDADNAAELLFRAAALQLRSLVGPARAAEMLRRLGDELLSGEGG